MCGCVSVCVYVCVSAGIIEFIKKTTGPVVTRRPFPLIFPFTCPLMDLQMLSERQITHVGRLQSIQPPVAYLLSQVYHFGFALTK